MRLTLANKGNLHTYSLTSGRGGGRSSSGENFVPGSGF